MYFNKSSDDDHADVVLDIYPEQNLKYLTQQRRGLDVGIPTWTTWRWHHSYSQKRLNRTYKCVEYWKRHVKALARFRCSNHNLAIERQRGILSKENRICKFCQNLGRRNIEDEIHFLLECPLYHHIRCSYSIFENINPNKSSFTSIMMTRNEECLRQLGSYIYRAMHIHKEYNA